MRKTLMSLAAILILVLIAAFTVPSAMALPGGKIDFCSQLGRAVAEQTYDSCMSSPVGPPPDSFDQSVCESDADMAGDSARINCLVGFYPIFRVWNQPPSDDPSDSPNGRYFLTHDDQQDQQNFATKAPTTTQPD